MGVFAGVLTAARGSKGGSMYEVDESGSMSESVLGVGIVYSSVSGSVSVSGVGGLSGNVSRDGSVCRSVGWSSFIIGSGSKCSSIRGIRSLARQR